MRKYLNKTNIFLLSFFFFCIAPFSLESVICKDNEKCCSLIEESTTIDCYGTCYDPEQTSCLLGKLCKNPCFIGTDPHNYYDYKCCGDSCVCCKSSDPTANGKLVCCSEECDPYNSTCPVGKECSDNLTKN